MLTLYSWIPKYRNKYYFYTKARLKNTISWRKIRDIVCINKWCERFCKEYDAKFLVYTEGDEILANVKLVFDESQAIFSNLIKFEDAWPIEYSISHEPALTAIDRRTTDVDIKRANETKDYRELIHLYQYVVEHDGNKL